MSFGVTTEGFKAKRLEDIISETQDSWREKFGDGFDLGESTPEGNIKGILDERMSLLWELAEAIANGYIPSAASGAQLDNILALNGLTREPATYSTVDSGRAFGTFGTSIPAGTVISVDGSPDSRFLTDNPATINNPAVNEVQTLAFSATPTSGVFNIVFPEGTTADINYNDSAAAVQAKCEAIIGAGNIAVSGTIDDTTGLTLTYQGSLAETDRDEITITGNTLDAGGAVTVTLATTATGTPAYSDLIEMTAEDTGPIGAPAGSLTTIETPVIGLDSFTNELDAELGTDIETDSEAKLRRVQELQIAGAATLNAIRADLLAIADVTAVVIFQNITSLTDGEGRPPHSLDIVVQGGDEDDVAEGIFDTIAAGIETIGDITKMVTDSQGFSQTVKFSRPTPVDIYLEIDLSTNAEFPVDGTDQVEAAILAYAEELEIGDDVVVFGSSPSISCAFQDIPGITDYAIRVGESASPTLDDNITIEPREVADFDSSRITVTEL